MRGNNGALRVFGNSGVTLLEMLVAVALLGLVTFGVMRLASGVRESQAKREARENAATMIESVINQLDRGAQKFIGQPCGAASCPWTAFVKDTDFVATTAAATQYYEFVDVQCEVAPAGTDTVDYFGAGLMTSCGNTCAAGNRPYIRWRENAAKVPAGHTAVTRKFVDFSGAAISGESRSARVVASSVCFQDQGGFISSSIQVVSFEPGPTGKPFVISKNHLFEHRGLGTVRITPIP